MTPSQAFIVVPTATVTQSITKQTVKMVPNTLKATLSSSVPNWRVAEVKTPIGKVKPHQPILNGMRSPRNRRCAIEAMAMRAQTKPKPQIMRATLGDNKKMPDEWVEDTRCTVIGERREE
jgi:hypothetical protein